MPDRMENFLEDRSYYFTLRDDARLLRRVAEMKHDTHVMSMLDTFMLRLHTIAALALAYWRHGRSGNRADIAWAMGFGEDNTETAGSNSMVNDQQLLDDLDSFLSELGFTDHDLHRKSLSELVHMDRVIGELAGYIETCRENYQAFFQCLSTSSHSSRSMT